VIGPDLANDETWSSIIRQADRDGNGEIDVEEFKALMQSV
jgi:Ca2+-binding EF-hand superfamily protein